MFRKRNRTILEETLTNVGGIDVYSDVGRALLHKMIECGHSENMVRFDDTSSMLKIYDGNSNICLAIVEESKYMHRSDNLREFIIWHLDLSGSAENIRVCSKYDIYRKATTDV